MKSDVCLYCSYFVLNIFCSEHLVSMEIKTEHNKHKHTHLCTLTPSYILQLHTVNSIFLLEEMFIIFNFLVDTAMSLTETDMFSFAIKLWVI